jgi:hypothetical protein
MFNGHKFGKKIINNEEIIILGYIDGDGIALDWTLDQK